MIDGGALIAMVQDYYIVLMIDDGMTYYLQSWGGTFLECIHVNVLRVMTG